MMLRSFNLAGAAILLAFSSSAVMAREFLSADVHNKTYPTTMAVKYMGDQLSKATNGKDSIKVFSPSALGSEKDTIEQVKMGALDMVRVSTATFHSTVPESVVPAMPFLFRDLEHFRKTMYGPQGEKILAAFEKAGFVALCMYEAGARSIYAKKPIKSPADLKGMSIRVQQSDLMVGMATALGATPRPMATADILTALKAGSVDAAENNYPSYEEFKHYEAAPVYSETMHSMVPEVVVFSKVVWDKLGKDEQSALRKAAKDSIPYYVKLWETKEKDSRAVLDKAGVQVIPAKDIDRKAFVETQKAVWEKFAKTSDQKALIREITSTR